MTLFIGTSASGLGLPSVLGVGDRMLRTGLLAADIEHLRSTLAAHTTTAPQSQLICRWTRSQAPADVHAGSAEIDDRFYRKAPLCKPFRTEAGLGFVAVIILAPSSREAADRALLTPGGLVDMHTVIRLFTSPIDAARSPLNLHLAEEHTPGGWPLLGFTAETLAFFNRRGQQTFTPSILELLSYWLRRDAMQLFEASDLALALVLLLCMSGVCAIAQCGYHTLLRCSRLRCSSSGTLLV